MIKKTLKIFIFLFCISTFSQNNFQFYGKSNEKQEVSFKLINNLIIIPLEINGHELSFILDTGVNKTILFNLTKNDSIGLNNLKKVFIRGLGDGEPVEALLSRGNSFKVNNILSVNKSLYVILKDGFNLSARMGTTIHGIIGYDLLKDVIAKINYNTKKITFYNPKTYNKKKCRKCEVFPLEFFRNKPYINIKGQIDTLDNKQTTLKLLIDTGGSDAIWLFEETKPEIKTPLKFFKDILGEGFSGVIYGNRSKIPQISLGKFIIKEPTVSFLDSTSTFNARKFKERNGSIGGNILKRFKIWIDYPNKKITLKKNSSLKNGFYYNMSGLQLMYDGQELTRQEEVSKDEISNFKNPYGVKQYSSTISLITTFFYKFKPKYKVSNVVIGSPAHKSGMLEGDFIKSINGKPAYEYELSEIMTIFQTKPNKRIRIKVKRGITDLKFEFRLKQRI